MTPEQREAEKNILKKKKLDEKKTEKIKNIRLQWALLKMDTEIKKSLKLDNTVNLRNFKEKDLNK